MRAISAGVRPQAWLMAADGLDVQISGSGDIQLAGKVNHQDIQISGAGNYRASECESQSTAVHISGSGEATIWAHLTLDGHVSGSGHISYHGSPQVTTHVSGSGRVHSLGNK